MERPGNEAMSRNLATALEQAQRTPLTSEAEVQEKLIEPVLTILGWRLGPTNREIWIPLSREMAQTWNYSSGRMRRDYVLSPHPFGPLHIEAKHRWGRDAIDLDRFLVRVNAGDWEDTRRDGAKKDLALLLWGCRADGGRRAALMDENRILVFDWDGAWRVNAEVAIRVAPFERTLSALLLIAP